MGHIIRLGPIFFLLALVSNLAYIEYRMCQIWSVYMQNLQCVDHSNKCLLLPRYSTGLSVAKLFLVSVNICFHKSKTGLVKPDLRVTILFFNVPAYLMNEKLAQGILNVQLPKPFFVLVCIFSHILINLLQNEWPSITSQLTTSKHRTLTRPDVFRWKTCYVTGTASYQQHNCTKTADLKSQRPPFSFERGLVAEVEYVATDIIPHPMRSYKVTPTGSLLKLI